MKGIKLLCYILSLCLLASFVPVSAFRADDGAFVSRLVFSVNDDEVLRAVVVFDGDAGIDLKNRGVEDDVTDAGRTVTSVPKLIFITSCPILTFGFAFADRCDSSGSSASHPGGRFRPPRWVPDPPAPCP